MVLWMLYAAAVGALVAAAATLIEEPVRTRRRHLWAASLLATGLLPLLLPVLRRIPWAPSPVVVDIGAAIPVAGELGRGGAAAVGAFSLESLLLGAWAATSALLLAALIGGALRIRRQRRAWGSRHIDGVEVRISRDLGPAVVGLRSPEIVLPEWVLELGAAELGMILAHEDEHRRRGDPVLLAAGLLVPVLLPWNPGSWWSFARLRDAVETDCDGRVVSRVGAPATGYARLLLRVGARTVGQVPLAAGFGERRSSLERRIRTMLGLTKGLGWRGRALRLVLAGLLVAAACSIEVNINTNDDDDVPSFEATEVRAPQVREIPAPADEEVAVGETVEEPAPLAEPAEREVLRLRRAPVPPPEAPRVGETAERPRPTTDGDLSEAPTFTPFTAAPSITNRAEVIAAMEREYPPLLRDAGIGGTVRIFFFIDAEGAVRDVRLDRSSGHEALDAAAMRVAGTYRFSPAQNREEPVPAWVSFPITFQVR